jgi:phage regulator Rha-like protein
MHANYSPQQLIGRRQNHLIREIYQQNLVIQPQFAMSKKGRGGRRRPPLALTEHGVVMAANVLRSPRAVAMSLEVVRAFIRLRKAALSTRSVRSRVAQLETAVKRRLDRHDADITRLFRTVEELLTPEADGGREVRRIGFIP